MNEEEARTKLRARLDGWQVYLREQDPTLSGNYAAPESQASAENSTRIEAEKSVSSPNTTLALTVTAEEVHTNNGSSVEEGGGIGTEYEAKKSAVLIEPGQRKSGVSQSNVAPIPNRSNRSSVKIVTLADAPLNFPSDAGFDEEEDSVAPLPAYSLQKLTPGHTGHLKVVFFAVLLFAMVGVGAILYEMYGRFG
jgi:hypothetical protein